MEGPPSLSRTLPPAVYSPFGLAWFSAARGNRLADGWQLKLWCWPEQAEGLYKLLPPPVAVIGLVLYFCVPSFAFAASSLLAELISKVPC